MKRATEKRLDRMRAKGGLKLKANDGEPISVCLDALGNIILTTRLSRDNGGLGQFRVRGLTAKKAASKKKSFWRKLWETIKDVAAAVSDAITVPVFGYRCRPDIDIDLSDGRFIFGIECKEA